MRRCAALLCFAALRDVLAIPPLGAEFTDRPSAWVNMWPQTYGPWMAMNGSMAVVDSDGWPMEDAYSILFDYVPWANDPSPSVPAGIWGNYSLEFYGSADIVVAPDIPVTVTNVSFDPALWRTRAVVQLSQTGQGQPGIALGFASSRRHATSPVSSGITRVRLLQPGYSVWDEEVPVFTQTALDAVAPLQQLRLMTPLGTNSIVANGSTLEWDGRRQYTDSAWGIQDYPRPTALAMWPWEGVVLLAQAVPSKPLWINMHVAFSGSDPTDTSSYLYNTAVLLRDGNNYTGSAGLPSGTTLYIEHGNELWLNGTVGGPDGCYMWNYDAAVREVAAGNSPLNNDGVKDPRVWAARRHVKRIREIHDIFAAVFEGTSITIRMVYGWYQDYVEDAHAALTWYQATYGQPPSDVIYGMAINSYYVVSVLPLSSQQDIVSALLLASDAALPSRTACSALVVQWGLTELMSYEGMAVALPAFGNSDNGTWATILDTMRSPDIGPVLKYDYEVNFAPLARAGHYNFFALASAYGPYPICTWGLSEDMGNTTTPKWTAVKEMLVGPGAEPSPGTPRVPSGRSGQATTAPRAFHDTSLRTRRDIERRLKGTE